MTTAARAIALAAVVPALAACGGSTAAGSLTAAQVSTLHRDVQTIRSEASASRPIKAHDAVGKFTADIGSLLKQHKLSTTDAHRLLVGARQANAQVTATVHRPAAAPATVTTTTTTSTVPAAAPSTPASPAPPGPAKAKAKAKGAKPGKGHGSAKTGGDGGGD